MPGEKVPRWITAVLLNLLGKLEQTVDRGTARKGLMWSAHFIYTHVWVGEAGMAHSAVETNLCDASHKFFQKPRLQAYGLRAANEGVRSPT